MRDNGDVFAVAVGGTIIALAVTYWDPNPWPFVSGMWVYVAIQWLRSPRGEPPNIRP